MVSDRDLLDRMAEVLGRVSGRNGGVMAFTYWDQADVRAVLAEYDERAEAAS